MGIEDVNQYLIGDVLPDLPQTLLNVIDYALSFSSNTPDDWNEDFVQRASLDALYRSNLTEIVTVNSGKTFVSTTGLLSIEFDSLGLTYPWYVYKVY